MSVTIAIARTVVAHKNMVFARAEIVNGRFVSARLILETRHSRGANTLHVGSIRHLRDIVQATQELLQSLDKEIT